MLRKVFNMQDYRRTKLLFIGVVISLALFIPTRMLVHKTDDALTGQWDKTASRKDKEVIQTEVQRRRSERKKDDTPIVKTPPVSPVDSTDTPSLKSTSVSLSPHKSSDPPSRVLLSGPYKGMTPKEVEALEKRKTENVQNLKANTDRLVAASKARSQNMDDEDKIMFSLFKSLSPEQLEHVREEALKKFPSEDVDFFFKDLENKGVDMTEDQLAAETQRILASNEALNIVFRELKREREALEQEYQELFGENE